MTLLITYDRIFLKLDYIGGVGNCTPFLAEQADFFLIFRLSYFEVVGWFDSFILPDFCFLCFRIFIYFLLTSSVKLDIILAKRDCLVYSFAICDELYFAVSLFLLLY